MYFDKEKACETFIEFLVVLKKVGNTSLRGIIASDDVNLFKQEDSILKSFIRLKSISQDESFQILGQSFDLVLLDFRRVFNPNKICQFIETVRGGGLIFIIGSKYPEWLSQVNKGKFSQYSTINPSNINDECKDKSYLLKWFITSLLEKFQFKCDFTDANEIFQSFNLMPYEYKLDQYFNDILVSKDQKEILDEFQTKLPKSLNRNICIIITADRGRGKSTLIGLALANFLINTPKKRLNIVITAPDIRNTQTIFEMITHYCSVKGVHFSSKKKDDWIFEVKIGLKGKVGFVNSSNLGNIKKFDLLVIEEAATLPVDSLKSLFKQKVPKIMVSTVHGYEGSGRSFQIKITNPLKRQKQINYNHYTLKQPIRYLEDDKVENFLNYVFFLDAEPPLINKEILTKIKNDFSLTQYPEVGKHLIESNYQVLHDHIGILVYSHYRNQPNDLLVLCDSINHFLVGFNLVNNENTHFLLVSTQFSQEGSMNDNVIDYVESGKFIEGNLIPTVAIRHFSRDFARLKGLRIVRIAVHPEFINQGYGRKAIELILDYFYQFDWIGVSFGANVKLVKFWRKFGFYSVHLRPIKTPETGEWNLIMIRPQSNQSEEIINQASRDFILQFIELLKQSLHSMSYELVQEILKSCSSYPQYKPFISHSGKLRVENYLTGKINFLLAVDVMYELSKTYFICQNFPRLSSAQEGLLISRVLQGRSWGQTRGKSGLDWETSHTLMRKAIQKLYNEIFRVLSIE
ncbi:GNAT family N-acetyltransferase [Candidatus Hodarchaeum mangrovi]